MSGTTQRAGSSVIVQPTGTQTATSIVTRAAIALQKVSFTGHDLQDSGNLFRVLHTIQQNIAAFARVVSTNPFIQGNLIQGLVFTPGQTRTFNHGLGHAYVGWWCTRAQTNAASLVEAALPAGISTAQMIALTSANAGTYDVWVF